MKMKRIGTVILLLLALGFAWMLYSYLSYRHHNAVSDAAFVRSDALYTLGFKVGGKIDSVHFKEGDNVDKGATLATIDPTDFQIQKARTEHAIEAMHAKHEALVQKRKRLFHELGIRTDISKNNIGVSDEKRKALVLKIDAAKTKLAKLGKDRKRFQQLLRQNLVSQSDYEKVDTAYTARKRELEAARKELDSYTRSTQNVTYAYHLSELEQTRIKELDFSLRALEADIKAARKNLEAITRKIDYCTLHSPIDGKVAKRFVNLGRVVSKGTPVYAVVDTRNKHIEVLLSEKKLHGVQPGNRVKITLEALPGKEYKGVVESILPTSAATFSLVPRDIASGEFTKLDQRFTVRIRFDESEDRLKEVLVGMGASVGIERK